MVVSEFQLSMNVKLNSFINLPDKYYVFVLTKWQQLSLPNPHGKEERPVDSLVSTGSVVVTLPCCFGTLAAQHSGEHMLEEAYSHHRGCDAMGEKKHTCPIEREQKQVLKNNDKLEIKPSTWGLWETPRFKVSPLFQRER